MAEKFTPSSLPSTNNTVRKPNLIDSRIFVSNLPACTQDELEQICQPHGKVLGSFVKVPYGCVQFENKRIADQVAALLNKTDFKGTVITVHNAADKSPHNGNNNNNNNNNSSSGTSSSSSGTSSSDPTSCSDTSSSSSSFSSSSTSSSCSCCSCNNNSSSSSCISSSSSSSSSDSTLASYSDYLFRCEILSYGSHNTEYARYIESRLISMGINVKLNFPRVNENITDVLASSSLWGYHVVLVLLPENALDRTISIYELTNEMKTYQHVGLHDALGLVEHLAATASSRASPKAAGARKKLHPKTEHELFKLLADNMPLTGLQLNCVIKYLERLQFAQLKAELEIAQSVKATTLFENVKGENYNSAVNKDETASDNDHFELRYPNLAAVKNDDVLLYLLKDESVKSELQQLFNSDVLESIVVHFNGMTSLGENQGAQQDDAR